MLAEAAVTLKKFVRHLNPSRRLGGVVVTRFGDLLTDSLTYRRKWSEYRLTHLVKISEVIAFITKMNLKL